ncbi:hypothetical protein PV326_001749, partial [Microctonus aethiopoides]
PLYGYFKPIELYNEIAIVRHLLRELTENLLSIEAYILLFTPIIDINEISS